MPAQNRSIIIALPYTVSRYSKAIKSWKSWPINHSAVSSCRNKTSTTINIYSYKYGAWIQCSFYATTKYHPSWKQNVEDRAILCCFRCSINVHCPCSSSRGFNRFEATIYVWLNWHSHLSILSSRQGKKAVSHYIIESMFCPLSFEMLRVCIRCFTV